FSETIAGLLAEAIALGDLRLKLKAAIGVAEAGVTPATTGIVLARAAAALQRARELGGSCLVVHDASLEESRERRLAMQADMRRGLDRDEFDLEYQPVFDFDHQALVAVEALLRWPRRADGPLSPAEFIPAAEAS